MDTGLLISQAFGEGEMTATDIQGRILMGAIEINKGMLMENVVAQMLRASKDLEKTDQVTRLPVYMAPFLVKGC